MNIEFIKEIQLFSCVRNPPRPVFNPNIYTRKIRGKLEPISQKWFAKS
jgi:hypothetical protein